MASKMGGRGDREENFHPKGLKMVFLHQIWLKMDQIGLKMDQIGLKIVSLYKTFLFGGNIVCGRYAFGGYSSE